MQPVPSSSPADRPDTEAVRAHGMPERVPPVRVMPPSSPSRSVTSRAGWRGKSSRAESTQANEDTSLENPELDVASTSSMPSLERFDTHAGTRGDTHADTHADTSVDTHTDTPAVRQHSLDMASGTGSTITDVPRAQVRVDDIMLAQLGPRSLPSLPATSVSAPVSVAESVVDVATLPPAAPATTGISFGGWGTWSGLGLLAAAGLGHRGGSSTSTTASTTSSTTSSTPAVTTGLSVTMNGALTAGPVTKVLHVTAYDSNGQVLAEADTDAKGNYTLSIAGSRKFLGGAVLLKVTDPSTGPDYIDEATRAPAEIGDLRAVVYVATPATGNSVNVPSVQITPLTTLAAELIAPLPDQGQWTLPSTVTPGTDIPAANRQVGVLFGLATTVSESADVTKVKPLTVISVNVDPDGQVLVESVASSLSNAYGKALAVLSRVQNVSPDLTAKALAASITGQEGLRSNSQALSLDDTTASQFSTAIIEAAAQQELSTADVSALQTANAGGNATDRALHFEFTQSSVALSTRDPANALGQTVFTLYQGGTSLSGADSASIYTANTGTRGVTYQLTGANADDFVWVPNTDPTDDNRQVVGWVQLKAPTSSTPVPAQLKDGAHYAVTLKAIADPLNTDTQVDDVSIEQSLTLWVVDTTAPANPNVPTVAFNYTDTLASTTALHRVGRPTATDTAHPFITVTDPDLAEGRSLAAGVRHLLTLTLENIANTRGEAGRVVKTWASDGTDHTITLSADDLTTLGDGTIKVTTTAQAKDLADNQTVPIQQTTQFILDTTVTTPAPEVLTNNSTASLPVSGDGKIRIRGLEAGATWTYRVLDDANQVVRSTADTPLTVNTTANRPESSGQYRGLYPNDLDVSALGTGTYTIEVQQTDSLGNVSVLKELSFQLMLDAPLGMDAQINQFEFYSDAEPPELLGVNTSLFQLGNNAEVRVSGVIRGALKSDEYLEYSTDNGMGWTRLSEDAVDLNAGTFSIRNVSLKNNSNVFLIRQADEYGHSTLLTSRGYVNQDSTLLVAPELTWLGAATTQDGTYTTSSMLRVAINPSTVSSRAVVEYLLSARQLTDLNAPSLAWSTTLPQPTESGTYYLYARQRDVLTDFAGEVSNVEQPMVISYVKPSTSAADVITSLYFQPAGLDGTTRVTSAALSNEDPIEGTDPPVPMGRTVVVHFNPEAVLVADSTLSMRWGNQLQTHVLTIDDVGSKTAYITWDPDLLLKQPGLTHVQAWVTDLTGQDSAKTSQTWTVGDPSNSQPTWVGWSTRTLNASGELTDFIPETDNAINVKESQGGGVTQGGVKLTLKLPTQTADGTPLTWANSATNANKAFSLSLFAKSASSTTWSTSAVTTATFEVDSDGVVEWILPSSVWSGRSGLMDWKVRVTNFSYSTGSTSRVTETALSELLVDLAPPSGVSLMVVDAPNDGSPSLAGWSRQQLDVKVRYSGMAAGDELVFSSQGGGNSLEVLRYVLKAEDIESSSVTLHLARDAISQGRGDATYQLGVTVTDAAGNSATLSGAKPQVTVDTRSPAAPVLQVASADRYLNATEDAIEVTLTWPDNTRVTSDTVKWLLGGQFLDASAATLTTSDDASATYRFMKSALGPEGDKDLRAVLVDASGNLGAVSAVLALTLDSEAHAASTLQWHPNSQAYVKLDSQMQLDIVDPQLQAGDVVKLFLTSASGHATPWGEAFTVGGSDIASTHDRITLTLHQGVGSSARGVYDIGTDAGAYEVTATVTDLAGNTSVLSSPLSLVVDLTPPSNTVQAHSVALSDHAVIDDTAATGHHRAFITQTQHQTLSATLTSVLSPASPTSGAESLWGRIATSASTADDGWVNLSEFVSTQAGVTSLAWDTDLTAGVNTLQFQVRDQAGNRGALVEQQYVLDQTAPTLTITSDSVHFSADTAPTGISSGALTGDFKTRTATQTLTLDLSAALSTDADDSATLGAGQDHLWASLDNGDHWTDVSAYVDSTGHLTWTGVVLQASNTLKFKVMDVAGNVGAQFSQAYLYDTEAPSQAISTIRFQDDTGLDDAGLADFITASPTTSIDFTFSRALLAGEHVYVRLDADASALDLTDRLRDAYGALDAAIVAGNPYTVTDFTLLEGRHDLTWWLEDEVGNVSARSTQSYVYAATAPTFDLDAESLGADATTTLAAPLAQHGTPLFPRAQVDAVPAGVAQVILTYTPLSSDNGANERLLIAPGVDVTLSSGASASPIEFSVIGVRGLVRLEPSSGSELHLSQWVNGVASAFTADEVRTLLSGLRYFNSAPGADIEAGDRAFNIQLIDLAANVSDVHTSTLSLESALPVTGRDATTGADILAGTVNDELLLGLASNDVLSGGQGNDVLWGYGGIDTRASNESNTFRWQAGDAASSANPDAAIDIIRDFVAWNGTHGDQLDLAGLLQGYAAGSDLAQWIQIDNRATVQGVTNSTRITVDVNGATTGGATQIIELQGVSLSSTSANDWVTTQLLKVL